MPMEITITILTGPHRNQQFSIQKCGRFLAGRAKDCQLQFNGHKRDSLISRYHCELEIDPRHVWIRDLGSRNGTYVNCQKLEPMVRLSSQPFSFSSEKGRRLEDGDIIIIGGSTWQIHIKEDWEVEYTMEVEMMEANS